MLWSFRTMLIGVLLGGAAALCGCEIEPDGAYVEAGYAQPAPAGYYYSPVYYDDGYYRGDYWYWRDHDRDRWYRERREMHERREHEWREHERHEHDYR